MRIFYLVLTLFTLLACTQEQPLKSVQKISLSNFYFLLNDSLKYNDTNENMALAKIDGQAIASIKVYNFGNKPISLQANLDRWKGQLKEVKNERIETFLNETIYYAELEGTNNESNKVFHLSAIIPSDEGPFYMKAICTESNYENTKIEILKILKSIKY